MKKRILALVMAFAMAMSLAPASVNAETAKSIIKTELSKLKAMTTAIDSEQDIEVNVGAVIDSITAAAFKVTSLSGNGAPVVSTADICTGSSFKLTTVDGDGNNYTRPGTYSYKVEGLNAKNRVFTSTTFKMTVKSDPDSPNFSGLTGVSSKEGSVEPLDGVDNGTAYVVTVKNGGKVSFRPTFSSQVAGTTLKLEKENGTEVTASKPAKEGTEGKNELTISFKDGVITVEGDGTYKEASTSKKLKGAAPTNAVKYVLSLLDSANNVISTMDIYFYGPDVFTGDTTLADVDNTVSISPSAPTYGNTLVAKYGKQAEGVVYQWYRGIYDKVNKTFVSVNGGAVYEALTAPVALTKTNKAYEYIIGGTPKADDSQADWKFLELNKDYEYRVFCRVTDTRVTDVNKQSVSTKAVPVTAKVLDFGDFVYGVDHESYVEYKNDAITYQNNGKYFDEAIENEEMNFGLVSSLYDGWADANLVFDIRYQEANAPLNRFDEDWLTAADLMTNGINKAQTGAYDVYVVGIMRDGVNILTEKTSDYYGTYTLKDADDNGEPILKIGTFNVQQTGYSSRATLVPESTGEVSGYLVDSEFSIKDVQGLANYDSIRPDELNDIQWYRVDDSNNWTAIEGATGETYKAKAADVGYYIGVRAKNWNYKGTIEGSTHAKIAKRVLSGDDAVWFTKGTNNRKGHYTSGGEFTVDVRDFLKKYGEAIADVEFNLSSHGTIASGRYDAASNQLVFKFRESDTVPTSFQVYKVDANIEFPGYIVELCGSVVGTNDAVRKVVIEPIESYEYDGTAKTTTAKAYLNEVEQENATITITYNGGTSAPSNAGDDYVAKATWNYTGGSVSDESVYNINKRKLTPTSAFKTEFAVGDGIPVIQSGWFNIVSKDNIQIENDIRKFVCAEDHSKIFGADPDRHPGNGTTKFYVGGEFYIHFDAYGNGIENYDQPSNLKILVGTGKVNADPTNPSTTVDNDLPAGAVKEVKNAIYRAYNKNDGDHLITKTYEEYLNVLRAGWRSEGYAFMSVDETEEYATEVYRLYNKVSGEHVYTANKAEYDATVAAGWRGEGVAFYAYEKDTNRGVSVYRLFNPNEKRAGSHHFTINKAEYDNAVAAGWKGENEVFRALEMPAK